MKGSFAQADGGLGPMKQSQTILIETSPQSLKVEKGPSKNKSMVGFIFRQPGKTCSSQTEVLIASHLVGFTLN